VAGGGAVLKGGRGRADRGPRTGDPPVQATTGDDWAEGERDGPVKIRQEGTGRKSKEGV
jgi:hypothetical protein